MKILVTGGLGYIGSHTVLKLLNLNHEVVVIDDLSNSSIKIKSYIESISKKNILKYYNGQIQEKNLLTKIFSENKIDLVMHLAGFKSVSESIMKPNKYYENNILGSIHLIDAMIASNVRKIVFSSTATVYDKDQNLPWTENSAVNYPDAPYGISKLVIERTLSDVMNKLNDFRVAILRYFNPIGAHQSGLLGDNFHNNSNNLIPNILKVISGKQNVLSIYGNDYQTPDGTCIRDYFHINDLIDGQIKAMNFIEGNNGLHIWNLGSGNGYSNLKIIEMFEKQINKKIPIQILQRRKGDLDKYWCDPSKARKELGWHARESLDTMVSDTLNYFNKNSLI